METTAVKGPEELHALSPSLEDYLETIYLLVQKSSFARVRDISQARNVKAASVSIALRKLAQLGQIKYERREYVTLTPEGESAGRRIYARHMLLTRFCETLLRMSPEAARDQACAMEHSLTDEAMDRLAAFFEFLGNCPRAPRDLLESFQGCPVGPGGVGAKGHHDCPDGERCASNAKRYAKQGQTLCDLKPGQRARVMQIEARGALRQRLLDMGFIPDALIDLERVGLGGDPLWVRCQGAHLALRRSEARSIHIQIQ